MIRHPRTVGTSLAAVLLVVALPVLATRSARSPSPDAGAPPVREADAHDGTTTAPTPLASPVPPPPPTAGPVPLTPAPLTPAPLTVDRPLSPEHYRLSPEGYRVARGEGPVVGFHGEVHTYTVEVEPITDGDLAAFLGRVREALEDPERGWASRGEVRLQWVDDPDRADLRVVLAHPDTVDQLCAEVDLQTHGVYSCWDGERALLNTWRWEHGAADFAGDLDTYRTYLVNHEVGHALGRTHEECPSAGAPAPIMVQQSVTTGACEPNGWPWPDGS